MEYTRVLLLVGLVALTSALPAERSGADDILKVTSGVLSLHGTVGARYRRQSSIKTQFDWISRRSAPWCFCGSNSWIIKLVENNFVETTSCSREAMRNFTIDDSNDFMKKTVNTVSRKQCAYECLFRRKNLLDSDGKLNKTAVKDMYKSKVFVEEGLKQTADTVLDRCLSTGTEFTVVSDTASALAGKGPKCNQEQNKLDSKCLLLDMARCALENRWLKIFLLAANETVRSKIINETLKDSFHPKIDRCLRTSSEFTVVSDYLLSSEKITDCAQEPYKFHTCLLLEMAQNCPKNLKKPEVDDCNKLYNDLEIVRMNFKSQ